MASELEVPILDEDLRSLNFFQGRILAAEDLRVEQETNRKHHWELGQACGRGVVFGLEVTIADHGNTQGSTPALFVERGLAINAKGQTLSLAARATVELTEPPPEVEADAGIFKVCDPTQGTLLANGAGVYVLVMEPASGFRDYAPMSGIESDGTAIGCGRRFALEGVQFRLERLEVDSFTEIDQERGKLDQLTAAGTAPEDMRILARFRNVLAHLFFRAATSAGQRPALRAGEDTAFTPAPSVGATLALTECDLPLGLFYWDFGGIRFCDLWTVRRLARQILDPAVLSLLPAHGLERLLQFQDQLAGLAGEIASPTSARARDYFRYLPPTGYLPVTGTSPRGFSPQHFFDGAWQPTGDTLKAAAFAHLLERSLLHMAIDLDGSPCLRTFPLVENQAAATAGQASQDYLAFVACDLDGPAPSVEIPAHCAEVASTFEKVWAAYRGLVTREELMPDERGFEELHARIKILEALHGVLDVANRHAGGCCCLDRDPLGRLQQALDQQVLLVELVVRSDLPDPPAQQRRKQFAADLQPLLEDLAKLIAAGDLPGALAIHGAINQFVDEWRDANA